MPLGGCQQRGVPLPSIRRSSELFRQRNDQRPLVSSPIQANQIGVLPFNKNDIGIFWIGNHMEPITIHDAIPVAIHNPLRVSRSNWTAPRSVVLKSAADVIRIICIGGDLIGLPHRNRVYVVPLFATIVAYVNASI